MPSAEFAFNSSRLDATGYKPFELDINWTPLSPLDTIGPKPANDVPTVDVLCDTLVSSLNDAKSAHEMAQARQGAYNSQKCRPRSYKVGDSKWLDKCYFTDVVYRIQTSRKLSAKRFGPFKVLELIGKNAIRIELQDSTRAHDVVHVEHTKPHDIQPPDIGQDCAPPAELHIDDNGDQVIEIGTFISHRRCGRGYQFLALPENSPTHEAQWQPLRDFIIHDRTITAALHSYLVEINILHHLH